MESDSPRISSLKLDLALQSAVLEERWQDVGVLLERGVSHDSYQWAVKQAGHCLAGTSLAAHILPHCRDEHLEILLTAVVRRDMWWMAGQLLKKIIGNHAQRAWAIEEAGKRAPDSVLAACVLPYCQDYELDALLLESVKRDLWETVSQILKRGADVAQCRWAVEEASRRADSNCSFVGDILHHCQDDQLESVLRMVVRRHLWLGVAELLQHDVDDSLRQWAVEEAVKVAGDPDLALILCHCTEAQIDFAVHLSVERGLWQCAGHFLNRGLETTLQSWVVTECCKRGSEIDLTDYVLIHCPDDQIHVVIKTITKRKLWVATLYLLTHNAKISNRDRKRVFQKASKHASDFYLVHGLLQHCTDEDADCVLPTVVKGGLWNAVILLLRGGLSLSIRRWVAEEALSRANDYHISVILPLCAEGQFEDVFTLALKKHNLPGIAALLKSLEMDSQRGWGVEKACAIFNEVQIQTTLIPLCPEENLSPVLAVLTSRGLWYAVGDMLDKNLGETEQWLSVEQAVKKAKEKVLIWKILGHCPEAKLSPALRGLVKRGFWEALRNLLDRNITDADRGFAVEEACKRAKVSHLNRPLLSHCPQASLQSVFTILVKRRLWATVETVLSMAVDKTRFAWVVDEVFQHAPTYHLGQIVRNHCLDVCVESGCGCGVSDDLRKQAVQAICGRASQILPYHLTDIVHFCSDDQLMSILTALVKRNCWSEVASLLNRDVISFSQQKEIVEQALRFLKKHDKRRMSSGVRGTLFGFQNNPDQRDRFLAELLEKGHWQLFVQMLETAREPSAKDLSPKKNGSHFITEDDRNLLHLFCASGLWRIMPYLAKLGVNLLAVDSYGCSLLDLAMLNKESPEKLLLQCIQMGVASYQTDIEHHATVKSRQTGMMCAVTRKSIVMMQMLYESGACLHKELYKVDQLLEVTECHGGEIPNTLRELKSYLEKLTSTPRSLKSCCRLVISQHLGVSGNREERVIQLPLPHELHSYLLFSDLADLTVDFKPAEPLPSHWSTFRATITAW